LLKLIFISVDLHVKVGYQHH